MSAVSVSLETLADLIGLPPTLRLVDRFGGVRVYVPQPARALAHSDLAQVVGPEAVRKLAEAWPGAHLLVPRGVNYLRRQRAIAIHSDREKLSLRELALKYEMTERNVCLVLAKPAPESAQSMPSAATTQGSLF